MSAMRRLDVVSPSPVTKVQSMLSPGGTRRMRRQAKFLRDWITHSMSKHGTDPQKVALKFSFKYTPGSPEEVVCVTGNVAALGAWAPEDAIPLVQSTPDTWHGSVVVPKGTKLEYRYLVKTPGCAVRPETAVTRTLELTKKRIASLGVTVLITDAHAFPECGTDPTTHREAVVPIATVSGSMTKSSEWHDKYLAVQSEVNTLLQNREHFVRAKIDTMTRDLTDENQALLRQVNSLEEAARISKAEADKAREAMARALVAKDKLRMEMKSRVHQMTVQNNQLKAENKSTKKLLSKMHGEVKEAARNASHCAASTLAEHEDTVRVLKRRAEDLKERWAADVAHWKAKCEESSGNASTELAAREQALAEAQQAQASLNTALEKAQTQLQRSEFTIAGLQQRCDETESHLQAVRQQHNKALQEAKEELEAERVKSQEALTTTQAAVREAEARAQAQVACVVSLERRVADEREQSAHLRSRVEELLQDQAALHTQLESQAHKAAEAAAAIQSLQQQLEASIEEAKAAESVMSNKLWCAQTEHREQIQMLQSEALTVTSDLRAKATRAMQKYTEAAADCRHWFNVSMTLKGNIRVFTRVRPLSTAEKSAEDAPGVNVVGSRALSVHATARDSKKFVFDRVFNDGESQQVVFREVSPLVTSTLDGYNVCVFAYGQTGAGKTHTMMGSKGCEGVIPRTVQRLFSLAQERADLMVYKFKVCVFEIYNEKIRDLLADRGAGSGAGAGSGSHCPDRLEVKLSRAGKAYVPGLTETLVNCPEDVDNLIAKAHLNRSVATTSMNAHSSRSHMVLSLHCTSKNLQTNDVTVSNMHLIDLAGSERLSRSQATGDTLVETQHINKSLSALGDVVHALQSKSKHIPFRNSQLTYLLKDSLGGNAKVLMMCQVSPTQASARETVCTLNFAKRAAAVKLGSGKGTVVSGSDERAKRELAGAAAKVKALEEQVKEAERAQRSMGSKATKEVAALKAEVEKHAAEASKARQLHKDAATKAAKAASRVTALEEQLAKSRAAARSARSSGSVAAKKAVRDATQHTHKLVAQVSDLKSKVAAAEALIVEQQQEHHRQATTARQAAAEALAAETSKFTSQLASVQEELRAQRVAHAAELEEARASQRKQHELEALVSSLREQLRVQQAQAQAQALTQDVQSTASSSSSSLMSHPREAESDSQAASVTQLDEAGELTPGRAPRASVGNPRIIDASELLAVTSTKQAPASKQQHQRQHQQAPPSPGGMDSASASTQQAVVHTPIREALVVTGSTSHEVNPADVRKKAAPAKSSVRGPLGQARHTNKENSGGTTTTAAAGTTSNKTLKAKPRHKRRVSLSRRTSLSGRPSLGGAVRRPSLGGTHATSKRSAATITLRRPPALKRTSQGAARLSLGGAAASRTRVGVRGMGGSKGSTTTTAAATRSKSSLSRSSMSSSSSSSPAATPIRSSRRMGSPRVKTSAKMKRGTPSTGPSSSRRAMVEERLRKQREEKQRRIAARRASKAGALAKPTTPKKKTQKASRVSGTPGSPAALRRATGSSARRVMTSPLSHGVAQQRQWSR